MDESLDALLALLDLEPIEVNLFRGVSPQTGWQRVFGGQVLGQALMAASRTVAGQPVHSLHGYFLRPGDPRVPILYDVDRIRDGKSFTTRRVVAIQHGRAIFNMAASFQGEEEGLEHQDELPDVPGPDGLESELEIRRRNAHRVPEEWRDHFTRERAIEMRAVDPVDEFAPEKADPRHAVWLRTIGRLPDDPVLHRCVLLYASDMSLLDTCVRPYGIPWTDPRFQTASLDHAMWFHRSFRIDDWLLYDMDSPSASGGRGFNRGNLFTRDGRLVASCTQEGLIRLHPESRR